LFMVQLLYLDFFLVMVFFYNLFLQDFFKIKISKNLEKPPWEIVTLCNLYVTQL